MFSAVIEWMDKHASSGKGDDEDAENSGPVLIATSDHECGGLSLAVELDGEAEAEYLWYPDVLLNGTHSTE